MLLDELNHPPNFENENGTKFWADKFTTKYAWDKGLDDIMVYLVKPIDGTLTRLIVKADKPIYENTRLESIAGWIDVLALVERDKHANN